ncbi:MAG: hypothetical protein ACRCXE_02005, partial [Metamycoplasmataceae bacterium]
TDMGGNSEAIKVRIRIFRIDEISSEVNDAIVELIVQGFINIGQNELDVEANRFVSSPTKTTDLSAIRTAANINAISEADRIHTLNLIVDLPTLSKGFGLKVNSASVNVTLESTLDISLSVFSLRDNRINKDFIYEVSNFKISDIETEIEKFVDTNTISSNISSVGIVQEIQEAQSQEAKRVALSKVTTLPLIEESFDFTINQVVVDKDDRTTILVVVSVFEKTNLNLARTIAYRIKGLKSSTVAIEAAKFTSTLTKKQVPASTYISQFDSTLNADNRLEILKEIADLPTLTNGFEMIVGSATINSLDNTIINVLIQIIEKGSSNNETVEFQIKGFKTPSVIVTIDEQTSLFEDAKTTYHPSFDPEEVVNQINGAATHEAKLTFLRTFVNVPTLHANFEFEVLSAIVRGETKNAIDVSIKIFEIGNVDNFRDVTLKIEGFVLEDIQAELAEEIAKFTSPTPTKSTIDSISKVVDKINGLNPNERIHALSLLANMPSLSEGFVLSVDSASIDQNAKTTLNVMIT